MLCFYEIEFCFHDSLGAIKSVSYEIVKLHFQGNECIKFIYK